MSNDDKTVPALGWLYVDYSVTEGVHLHIQEACDYPKLRFHWSLDSNTGKRVSRFFIRGTGYDDLNDAIEAWHRKFNKRKRVRLNDE